MTGPIPETKLGAYTIVRESGRGGRGQVYRAGLLNGFARMPAGQAAQALKDTDPLNASLRTRGLGRLRAVPANQADLVRQPRRRSRPSVCVPMRPSDPI